MNVPRFDDERTLRTARRVVPLEKINAKVRHRRQWLLGGAFAIAMMLGAGSALVASYLKLRSVPKVSNDSAQVEMASAPAAVAETMPEDLPAIEETELSAPEPSETPRKAPVRRRTAVAKHDQVIQEAPRASNVSEADDLNRIRQAVLYDEWQERRARRVLRRERRRQERYNHRDLSNLDEIFEGQRRPQL